MVVLFGVVVVMRCDDPISSADGSETSFWGRKNKNRTRDKKRTSANRQTRPQRNQKCERRRQRERNDDRCCVGTGHAGGRGKKEKRRRKRGEGNKIAKWSERKSSCLATTDAYGRRVGAGNLGAPEKGRNAPLMSAHTGQWGSWIHVSQSL